MHSVVCIKQVPTREWQPRLNDAHERASSTRFPFFSNSSLGARFGSQTS